MDDVTIAEPELPSELPTHALGPHATATPDGLLRCVHGVPTGPNSTTSCSWSDRLAAGDPVELWEKHGLHAHGVRMPLRWDTEERTVVAACEEVSQRGSLADTILADDEARVAARARQEAEHHARRTHILDALRAAVAPGADPGPVNALATALSVQPAALGDVMRELLR